MIEMVLCGRGGQGIVFLTRQIGDIATEKGWDVISSETHGMAVRGGSINSHLRIGPYKSSLIRQGQADMIISLDRSETKNNIHYLKPGGLIVENDPGQSEDKAHRIDASRLAREMGRIQLENVVMLGFAAGLKEFPIGVDDIRAQLSKDPREKVREMNLQALKAGFTRADQRAG
jgi:indolepyruvate ferredoxin oxidoreductase beta subunit